MKQVTVAVAGNPNCGKTTVFNGLTGGRQQIGNWPGVTVEKKEGRFVGRPIARILAVPFSGLDAEPHSTVHTGDVWDRSTEHDHVEFRVVDLPGIYSLSASSEDEVVARDYLIGGEPDLILNVIDASNIERNLYLTTQLAELSIPVVVVLTMIDIAQKKSIRVDVEKLQETLGVPVLAINAIERKEVARLQRELIELAHAGVDRIGLLGAPSYPEPLERAVATLGTTLSRGNRERGRFRAIRSLDGDAALAGAELETVERLSSATSAELGEELDVVFADSRYSMIQEITERCVRRGTVLQSVTERIDRIVIHRVFGFPVFVLAMFLVFWFTISIGGAFIDFFDMTAGGVFVDGFAALLGNIGAPSWLIAILARGIGGGLQTVASFIPVIFSMFFALAVLEDSGYMARAAFVMDRLMRWIGLPGKSFVPMLLGFGCTIPAVMATKTLESRRDRLMTIFMTPLMSCGARLPVYALLASAIFGVHAGLVVFSIYFAGIALAVLTGLVMKRTLFHGASSHFVLELPPYHAPRFGQILGASGRRLLAFLQRAGTTIVIMVGLLGVVNSITVDRNGVGFGGNPEHSLLAYAGKAVTPIFGPIGIERDNWPATVAIFAGLFAKEAAAGTLNSLYLQQVAGTDADSLQANSVGVSEPYSLGHTVVAAVRTIPGGLREAFGVATTNAAVAQEEATTFPIMRARFSRGAAYAYLLFILIYFPCVSALGVVIREAGRRLGWMLAAYLTISAWAISTIVYQLTAGANPVWIVFSVAILVAEYFVLRSIGSRHAPA